MRKVLFAALVIDVVYQIVELNWVYLGEARACHRNSALHRREVKDRGSAWRYWREQFWTLARVATPSPASANLVVHGSWSMADQKEGSTVKRDDETKRTWAGNSVHRGEPWADIGTPRARTRRS